MGRRVLEECWAIVVDSIDRYVHHDVYQTLPAADLDVASTERLLP